MRSLFKFRPETPFIALVVLIVFILPKSLELQYTGSHKEIGEELILWTSQRYVLVFLCAAYVLLKLRSLRLSRIEATAVAAASAAILLNSFQGTYAVVYGLAGSMASIALVKALRAGKWVMPLWLQRFMVMAAVLYAAQYLFYSLDGRAVASFIDANISGYYLFLACSILRAANFRIPYLAAVALGVFSLSRNFLAAIIVFEACLMLFRYFDPLEKLKSPNFYLSLTTVGLTIILTFWFIGEFRAVKENTGGFDRVMRLADESNQNRFIANRHFLLNVADGELVLLGEGTEGGSDGIHRPHNAFFRAVQRYGLLCALPLILIFIRISDYFFCLSRFNRALIVALYVYYAFLSDFITGPELVLFCAVNLIVANLAAKSSIKNRLSSPVVIARPR